MPRRRDIPVVCLIVSNVVTPAWVASISQGSLPWKSAQMMYVRLPFQRRCIAIIVLSSSHIVLAFSFLLSVAHGTKLLGVSFTVGVFMVFLLFDCTIGLHLHSVDAVERPLRILSGNSSKTARYLFSILGQSDNNDEILLRVSSRGHMVHDRSSFFHFLQTQNSVFAIQRSFGSLPQCGSHVRPWGTQGSVGAHYGGWVGTILARRMVLRQTINRVDKALWHLWFCLLGNVRW